MADPKSKDDDIVKRRDDALRRLLNTPPDPKTGKGERPKKDKPHAPKKPRTTRS